MTDKYKESQLTGAVFLIDLRENSLSKITTATRYSIVCECTHLYISKMNDSNGTRCGREARVLFCYSWGLHSPSETDRSSRRKVSKDRVELTITINQWTSIDTSSKRMHILLWPNHPVHYFCWLNFFRSPSESLTFNYMYYCSTEYNVWSFLESQMMFYNVHYRRIHYSHKATGRVASNRYYAYDNIVSERQLVLYVHIKVLLGTLTCEICWEQNNLTTKKTKRWKMFFLN